MSIYIAHRCKNASNVTVVTSLANEKRSALQVPSYPNSRL